MRSCRRAYAALLLFLCVLIFFSGNAFLAGVLALAVLWPLFLHVFLRIDTAGFSLRGTVKPSCLAGSPCNLTVEVECDQYLLTAAMLSLTLEYENRLFSRQRTETVRVGMKRGRMRFTVPFQPELCGETWIRLTEAECFDLFGLCKRTWRNLGEYRVTVHPRQAPLELRLREYKNGEREGERYYQNRKGADISEIFDLREYNPGDDVRTIHWKLSGKLDRTLIREGSDASQYHTLLLFDAGARTDGVEWDGSMLCAAVELGISLSRRLLDMGIPHYVAIPTEQGLLRLLVGSYPEYEQMVDTWMGLRMASESGQGIRRFQMDRLDRHFSRTLYVTAGVFPALFFRLAGQTPFFGVCVTGEDGALRTGSHGMSRLMEIPAGQVREKPHTMRI